MKYTVHIEEDPNPEPNRDRYSASVVELEGVVTCGDTLEEVKERIHEATLLWIEYQAEQGIILSPPTSYTLQAEVVV